jgi:hypothetical protein
MPFENFGEGIFPREKFFSSMRPPKGTPLEHSASFEISCVQIGGICAYISPIWGAAPSQPIITIFGMFNGLADLINCAKFQNDWLRGFCLVGA